MNCSSNGRHQPISYQESPCPLCIASEKIRNLETECSRLQKAVAIHDAYKAKTGYGPVVVRREDVPAVKAAAQKKKGPKPHLMTY